MSQNATKFGTLDGQDVLEVRLKGASGIEVGIVTLGASIKDLQVSAPEGKRHVILGFPSFEDLLANKGGHWGAVPGRVANRIAHGTSGFGVRNWTIKEQTPKSVTLEYKSVDGEEGFPGNLTARTTYTITNENTLRMDWSATTDQDTIINLTSHAYYNLNGTKGDNTAKHSLLFDADHYTPVDDALIPTGEIKSVEGTPFDFRQSRAIETSDSFHYDHNWVLRDHTGGLRRAAELISSEKDLKMEIWTDQPGIQFFDGKPLNIAQPGHDGMKIGSRFGIALEPQIHPDAINHKNFPNTVLKPGETYKHHSELRFSQL